MLFRSFNAMKATLVEYEDKGGDIIIGDITINNGATKATPVTSKVKADATSISDEKTADGYYTVEFAEKYCKDLKVSTKSADQVDSFGRPATTWVYDGDTVGTYGDEADDSIVLNKSIDAQKAIVTDSDYMNYSEDDVASKIMTEPIRSGSSPITRVIPAYCASAPHSGRRSTRIPTW